MTLYLFRDGSTANFVLRRLHFARILFKWLSRLQSDPGGSKIMCTQVHCGIF
jgi:hypothetical protein